VSAAGERGDELTADKPGAADNDHLHVTVSCTFCRHDEVEAGSVTPLQKIECGKPPPMPDPL
jgi:hypothetical protein